MFYKILHNPDHASIKQAILDHIDRLPADPDDDINKTDWMPNPDTNRAYFQLIRPFIESTIKPELKRIGGDVVAVDNVWFQQYVSGNYHGWHTHSKTHFSCVYYVELPSNELATEIIDFDTGMPAQPPVKEGDLLLLPGFIAHRSPVIPDGKRKTVVVFNVTIHSQRE